ncbi:MAG: geranylgeranylglyceryl/heptaprenylglyceryl phosphate synthase, partial [Sphingomonadales bacterium]
ERLDELIALGAEAAVDFWFVGGSLVISHQLEEQVQYLKKHSDIPVILFPGSPSQVTRHADALLYLSLVSGRNADLLIGQHVLSAPLVKQSGLEVLPTGYMVIDGGAPTTVSYISNASPIPANKKEIAQCTAMAAEMLGMKLIYLDAGSGARTAISEEMVTAVSSQIDVPLIVGGGITTAEKAAAICRAGADVVVVGNAIEKDRSLIRAISEAVHHAT